MFRVSRGYIPSNWDIFDFESHRSFVCVLCSSQFCGEKCLFFFTYTKSESVQRWQHRIYHSDFLLFELIAVITLTFHIQATLCRFGFSVYKSTHSTLGEFGFNMKSPVKPRFISSRFDSKESGANDVNSIAERNLINLAETNIILLCSLYAVWWMFRRCAQGILNQAMQTIRFEKTFTFFS